MSPRLRHLVLLAAAALVGLPAPAAPAAQPRPTLQARQDLRELQLRTGEVTRSQRVCVRPEGGTRAWCVEPGRRVLVLRDEGRFVRRLRAEVRRAEDRAAVTVSLEELRVRPGRLTLRAIREDCTPARRCDPATATASRSRRLTIREVVVAGCRAKAPWQVTSGRRSQAVALTFDDGPGPYTRSVLDVLRRDRVPATFYVLGKEVPGRGSLLRRMTDEGHEIGNHSWSHASLAGGGALAASQLRRTERVIRRETGYLPCTMRPPYRAISGALVGVARSLDLVSVLWSVDPQDWRNPGAGAIRSGARLLRGGGIIILHDGGGPRGGTVAALPGIIRDARARGLRFATVRDLLGLEPVYGYRR